MKPVRIGVSGAAGRMGKRVVAIAAARKDVALSCALESPDSAALGSDAGELAGVKRLGVPVSEKLVAGSCDVLVDFSSPRALPGRLSACLSKRIPWVVCATGWDEPFRARLKKASRAIPIVLAPNTSLGANLLRILSRTAAETLAPHGVEVEIIEAHHARKKDAPSGTALWVAEAIEEALGSRKRRRAYGRRGPSGSRSPGKSGSTPCAPARSSGSTRF